MTDQAIPAGLTRDQAQAVREWAERSYAAKVQDETMYHAARVLLAVLPKRPTLAEMTEGERRDCQWMQCEVRGERRIITLVSDDGNHSDAVTMAPSGYFYLCSLEIVTPRPDLPRLEWPDADQGGEEVTKVDYVSVAGGRTAYGPWTVARLRKKADTAPALPYGWRIADHEDHGRVIVTNTTPDEDGHVYFVAPAPAPLGNDWHPCDPAELTYIDQESADAID